MLCAWFPSRDIWCLDCCVNLGVDVVVGCFVLLVGLPEVVGGLGFRVAFVIALIAVA